jgi:hypothetical protein
MAVYRQDMDGFAVVRPFLFNARQYHPDTDGTFWRAEAGASEHQVKLLFRQGEIGPPAPPAPAASKPAAKVEDEQLFPAPKVAPARAAPRGR